MSLRLKIRISLWSILFFIIAFLLYLGLVPFGSISYSYDFEKDSSFISKLSPETRVELKNNSSQKIIGDPVYFTLHTPRKFDQAKIGVYFKSDNLEMPIIESGVMVDGTLWRYDLKPLENKIIDTVCGEWGSIIQDRLIFCQREKNFMNIDDFLNSTSSPNSIALYNYKIDKEFILDDYSSSTKEYEINSPIRGSYQFYTYIKDEKMEFNFLIEDINANKDSDKIDLNIYYNDLLIDTRHMDDDGNTNDDHKISGVRNLKLVMENLPEAAYKIELRVNDDIITKQIKSKQKKLAFINKLNFAKSDNKQIRLHSDAKRFEAITIYPDSLQTIKINEQEFQLDETYKQYSLNLPNDLSTSSISEIILSNDGVTVSGNGVFAFSKEAIINPSIKKVDANFDLKNDNIKYVLGEYTKPEIRDGWKYAEIDIDLTKAYRENRSYSFIISAPGLRADDETDDYFEIDKIIVDLKGENIVELIKNRLKHEK